MIRSDYVNKFAVDILNQQNYQLALKPFIVAMDFARYYGDEQEIEEWIAKSIDIFYKNSSFHCVGVRDNQNNNKGKYIGFASLIPLETTGWIPYVGVDPKYQGHGLGKKLMTKIFEIAEQNQLETIELCSSQKGLPFYQSIDFKVDYPVCGYDIVEAKRKSRYKLQIDSQIPEWIYKMDKKVVGINRKKLFHIHSYDHLTIINEPDHGYGILYKTRIGPIVADSLLLAQEIILKAIDLGATSLVLVENSEQKNEIHEVVKLKPQALMDNIKVTYGMPLNQDLGKLYGLRSVAYG
jgi:ribosomal protein S18 acetylase RimI-like enzyme